MLFFCLLRGPLRAVPLGRREGERVHEEQDNLWEGGKKRKEGGKAGRQEGREEGRKEGWNEQTDKQLKCYTTNGTTKTEPG